MSNESERTAASIRSIATKPEERAAFVAESVKKVKDLQGKSAQDYENAVSALLMCLENFDIIHGTALDIYCELTVLDVLVSLDLSAMQVSLCTSYVQLCLKGVTDCAMAAAAAKTFAESLTLTTAAEFARTQVEEAIKWIGYTAAHHQPLRVCGMLVLTEVALHVPMMLLPKMGIVFDKLWDGLSCPDPEVRPRALFLFTLCTKLLANRPQSVRAETFESLMRNLTSLLGSKSKDKCIAGLLAFEPFVINSPPDGAPGSLLRYEDLSILLVPFIMGSGAGSDPDIRELIFRCLIVVCRFSTALFVSNQLKDTVRFALESVQQNLQRGMAFKMLSEIIPIVGAGEFEPFVDDTCAVIKDIFVESVLPCWEALQCFSVVCQVCLPTDMETYVNTCIDHVFKWGLSAQLTESMRSIIASSKDDYRVKLEESLLDMISVTLCGLPFRQQADFERLADLDKEIEPSEYQISVALNALMQFGFSNTELMGDFLRDSVLPFIDSSSAAVRNAAIYTIVKLLIPAPERGDLSIARRMCVNTVVSRMLVVGLSDPNAVVRQTILSAFTEDFYPYLSEPQFLLRFCSALGDESINCRVAAIEQLCHMVTYDPSHILPALREQMLIMIHFIESTFNTDTVQNGLRLLAAIASKAPSFVVNFTDSIVAALQPYFSIISTRTVVTLPFLLCCTAVVKAVHLFSKQKDIFTNEVPTVCELLISLPLDRSYHAVRLSCLRFLSATLSPLVCGETPYKAFPMLFPLLSSILRNTEEGVDIRLEALKCVGTVGALDSHIFQSLGIADGDDNSIDSAVVFNRVTHQKCCRVVLRAIAAQMDPLEKRAAVSSSSREALVRTCVQTVLNVAARCPCSKPEMSVVIAPLARVLCQMGPCRLFVTLLYEFGNLVKFVGDGALKEMNAIVAVFDDVWERQRAYRFLAVRLLSIVTGFECSGNYHASQQQSSILPKLFDSLHRIDSTVELKFAVLEYIVRHVGTLQGYCESVVDNLLSVIQNPATLLEFLNAAIAVLKVVCTHLYVDELVGSIVRSLLVCLSNELTRAGQAPGGNVNGPLFANVMGVFCVLCEDMQTDFLKYSFYITQTLKTFRIGHTEFSALINQVMNGVQCVRSAKIVQSQRAEVAALLRMCDGIVNKSIVKLGEAWNYTTLDDGSGSRGGMANVSDRVGGANAEEERGLPVAEQRILATLRAVPLTREEWLKWADQFSVSILQESPFQVFRCTSLPIGNAATPLVERSRQLTQDLVQVAFRTLWTFGSANLRLTIVDFFKQSLRQAMDSVIIPDDVLALQLSIVEYMDHVGETLSVPYTDLSECAWARGMLAKALYWREAAYREEPTTTVESLISLYSELHMVDSSVGILNQASEAQRRALLHSSLVKLARYTEALTLTEQELEQDTMNAMFENSSCESFSRSMIKGSVTGVPGGAAIRGNYRDGSFSRRMRYGTNSDVSSSFRHGSDEMAQNRLLESTARLMLCNSELGVYNKVLDEWERVYKAFGNDGAPAATAPAAGVASPISAATSAASPTTATSVGSTGGGGGGGGGGGVGLKPNAAAAATGVVLAPTQSPSASGVPAGVAAAAASGGHASSESARKIGSAMPDATGPAAASAAAISGAPDSAVTGTTAAAAAMAGTTAAAAASPGASAAAVSAANNKSNAAAVMGAAAAASDESSILRYVSQYAADAAIRLQSWDRLRCITAWMPQDTVQYHISMASLCIVDEDYDEAMTCVARGRQMLLVDLAGLLHESYARAYEGLVIAQELTEVEEVIVAKKWQAVNFSSDHVGFVLKLWDQRMRMMAPTVPAWKQVLGVRGILIPPVEDVRSRIRFVKLCRQENAKQQEKFTLDQLLGVSNPSYEQLTSRTANPRVVMQYITYLSASDALGPGSAYGDESELIKKLIDVHSKTENSQILSRAYARLGTKVGSLEESVDCFQAATLYDPKWYLGWRLWGQANAEILSSSKEFSAAACTNAVEGFIHSIQLGTSDSTLIQDVLKLLTHWSKHCDQELGLKTLRNRVLDVPSRVWHLVVPQLIARLDSGSDASCHLVADLLTSLAYDYPHTLLYPLNLCTMSDSERRKWWANEILGKLQARYPVIVLQGRLMIDELIRVSGLIYEQWYDKLEAAATAYFGRHNRQEMIRTLVPMHETLTRVSETIIETEFLAKYTRPLTEAREWVRSYSSTKNLADLQAAWNLYHGVYRRIDDQIKANSVLKMQFCSPKLFEARDLAIGVPDAHATHEEALSRIASFQEKIVVITSKQRPKRIAVMTAEGRSQKYLLKGREDLRLDERVMQLFALVNILMLSDSRSCQNFGFQIQRYSVTPLKDTVGLIGWVDGCDTLHELVKFYREKKSIPVELELRMLGQIITYDNPKAYDHLAIMSKVEVMEFLADHTSGHDIRKAMWAMASNCEVWMDQRQMFTTSLANMSVVGYILGLGDRHPNNIMVQKASGLVVHIDFGDCFEVAMTRDKFPEKVPFRLTRMLRNALDVSGVDGAFRANAEGAMCVLREGSHSVLALMEAFIQDPLISWRLLNRTGEEPETSTDHKTIEEQLNLATGHQNVSAPTDSITASITGSISGGRRDMESLSVAKHLFGEEVDVVHQGVFIFSRLSSKLKGQDFITTSGTTNMDPQTQVGRLIAEAIDIMNVAQSWSGWYPYW